MTYEKAWKNHRKWLEESLQELERDLKEAPEEEKKIYRDKITVFKIIQHRMLQDEAIYPLEEKELELKNKKQLEG